MVLDATWQCMYALTTDVWPLNFTQLPVFGINLNV